MNRDKKQFQYWRPTYIWLQQKNVVSRAAWCPGFVHPCTRLHGVTSQNTLIFRVSSNLAVLSRCAGDKRYIIILVMGSVVYGANCLAWPNFDMRLWRGWTAHYGAKSFFLGLHSRTSLSLNQTTELTLPYMPICWTVIIMNSTGLSVVPVPWPLGTALSLYRTGVTLLSRERFFIYLINKYISLSDICLTVHHWYK